MIADLMNWTWHMVGELYPSLMCIALGYWSLKTLVTNYYHPQKYATYMSCQHKTEHAKIAALSVVGTLIASAVVWVHTLSELDLLVSYGSIMGAELEMSETFELWQAVAGAITFVAAFLTNKHLYHEELEENTKVYFK